MGESVEFIKDRRVKTLSAASDLAASWVWQEKPIAAMQAELKAIVGDPTANPALPGQEAVAGAAEQVMLTKRGTWDTALDQLHRCTVQGVGMAKTRFRDNPVKLGSVANLSARGTSRSETLTEALAWESAWALVDPAWAPLPANTLAAFKELRAQCVGTLQTDYSDAQSAWSTEAKELAALALAMEQINEAWYADATKVFLPGTPEGDMIRSTVPTTYTPPPPKPATPKPLG